MKRVMVSLSILLALLMLCSCASSTAPTVSALDEQLSPIEAPAMVQTEHSQADNRIPLQYVVTEPATPATTTEAIPVSTIDAITWELIQINNNWWDPISPFLPYMSSNNVEKLVQHVTPIYHVAPDVSAYLGNGSNPTSADPLTPALLDSITLQLMQYTGRWSAVEAWFPYMTADGVKNVANLYISKGNSRDSAASALPYINGDLTGMPPYVDSIYGDGFNFHRFNDIESMTTDEVDAMAIEYIEQEKSFAHVYNMRPYMSAAGIDAAVLFYLDQGGNPQDIATMLQFTSRETTGQIVQKYFMD